MPSISSIAHSVPDTKSPSNTTYPPTPTTPATATTLTNSHTPGNGVFPKTPTSPYGDMKDGTYYMPSEYGDATEDGEELDVYPKNDIEARDSSSPPIVLTLPERPTHVTPTTGSTHPQPRRAPVVPLHLPRSPASALGFDWDAIPASISSEKNPSLSRTTSYAASRKSRRSLTSFLFARSTSRPSSPTSLGEMSQKVTPIFAPLTRVVNPLIVRGMAEIVRRSTFWGGVFGVILTAVTFIVPFKGAPFSYGW